MTDDDNDNHEVAIAAAAQELGLAVTLLSSVDPERYQPALDYLHNQYVLGLDQFPRTLLKACDFLSRWNKKGRGSDRSVVP